MCPANNRYILYVIQSKDVVQAASREPLFKCHYVERYGDKDPEEALILTTLLSYTRQFARFRTWLGSHSTLWTLFIKQTSLSSCRQSKQSAPISHLKSAQHILSSDSDSSPSLPSTSHTKTHLIQSVMDPYVTCYLSGQLLYPSVICEGKNIQ